MFHFENNIDFNEVYSKFQRTKNQHFVLSCADTRR